MKITRLLLSTCAFLLFATMAVATTLQVKVTEVQSGNTLVVSNTSRALKVRLKGIAPPEAGQPFSDVARAHLKMLVLDKAVALNYTSLSDGYFAAKISINGIDVGSQMLRDGAAWYDHKNADGLTDADRELYAACEKAARDEKRGLWSDGAAVAPWEFREAKQQETSKQSTPLNFSAYQVAAARKAAANRVLSNRHFGRGDVQPGAIAGQPTIRLIAPNATSEEWITYKSASPRFSIRVPGNSYFFEYPILDNDLKIVNMSYVVGISDGSLYMMMWTKASNDNATDTSVADSLVEGLIRGINHYFEAKRLGVTASFSAGRAVRLGGYAGKQYPVSGGDLSGFARIISKRIGDEREVFALAVFSAPGDESAFDFLNSLKISETGK